jgi:hypothetical protein
MRPKQREAFDLLTLQLVERGYVRRGPPGPPEWDGRGFLEATAESHTRVLALLQAEADALALQRQRDAAEGLSRPGSWYPVHAARIDIFNERKGGGRWEIHVEVPDYENGEGEGLEDCLGYKVAAPCGDGRAIWLDDGALIVWEGLDLALLWAEDLAWKVAAAQKVT